MGDFFSVFAAIDMEHEFFLGEDMVGVERALGLLGIFSLFEHPPNYYMPSIDFQA